MQRRRPSSESWPAILGSIALHVGVLALAFVSWPKEDPLKPVPSSVPVSILSSETIEAAAPDNPAEELVTEDAATAPSPPVEAPPTPTPPAPTPPAPTPPRPMPPRPTPAPLRPTPAPTPRPTPPRPTPTPTPSRPAPARPMPTPARPTPAPARPAPSRPEPTLDLSSLAQGPRRPGPAGPRAATGQQGAGQASQATGPQLGALARQVTPNWNVRVVCDLPGGDAVVIRVRVRLDAEGRIQGTPVVENAGGDAARRAASDSILQALRATSPFEVPLGFSAQEVPFRFETARQCGAR